MKTTDLIPLILLELSTGDKYGIELTKSIETKSNGKIVIKQPTLYTILKKLEKSKFISSYWEDSEIGGKRHYYKLTENGKMQVSTLPSYSQLISSISLEEDAVSSEQLEINTEETTHVPNKETSEKNEDMGSGTDNVKQPEVEEKYLSIMDLLLGDNNENNSNIETKESILPTDEVFENGNIDNATEIGINQQNTNILKETSQVKDETFASNDNVSKFTQTNPKSLSDEYVAKLKEKDNSVKNFLNSQQENKSFVDEDIKYVDYINLTTNESHLHSKKIAKNMLYRILSSCAYLLLMLIVSSIAVSHISSSPLYYVFVIFSILFILFSISIYLLKYEQFRLKHLNKSLKVDIKKQLIVVTAIFLAIFILCVIVSACSGVANIFAISNFANLYAPLLMSTTLYIDVLFSYLFFVKFI